MHTFNFEQAKDDGSAVVFIDLQHKIRLPLTAERQAVLQGPLLVNPALLREQENILLNRLALAQGAQDQTGVCQGGHGIGDFARQSPTTQDAGDFGRKVCGDRYGPR